MRTRRLLVLSAQRRSAASRKPISAACARAAARPPRLGRCCRRRPLERPCARALARLRAFLVADSRLAQRCGKAPSRRPELSSFRAQMWTAGVTTLFRCPSPGRARREQGGAGPYARAPRACSGCRDDAAARPGPALDGVRRAGVDHDHGSPMRSCCREAQPSLSGRAYELTVRAARSRLGCLPRWRHLEVLRMLSSRRQVVVRASDARASPVSPPSARVGSPPPRDGDAPTSQWPLSVPSRVGSSIEPAAYYGAGAGRGYVAHACFASAPRQMPACRCRHTSSLITMSGHTPGSPRPSRHAVGPCLSTLHVIDPFAFMSDRESGTRKPSIVYPGGPGSGWRSSRPRAPPLARSRASSTSYARRLAPCRSRREREPAHRTRARASSRRCAARAHRRTCPLQAST